MERLAGLLHGPVRERTSRFAPQSAALAVQLLRQKLAEEIGDRQMKPFPHYLTAVVLVAVSALVGCSSRPARSPDIAVSVRQSLDQAGLKDVTVSQDRDKGVVTLGGHVSTDADKAQAEFLARPIAVGQVVAVQIAVIPVGAEKEAKTINSDLDKGIENNLDAALIHNQLHAVVHYTVKNAVVTLTGEVDSQARRATAETVAAGVPNVKQVVNTVQVKNQKATSTR
jgi:hyperosmotically inducible periplasmic protein